jgi:hypothetical protein
VRAFGDVIGVRKDLPPNWFGRSVVFAEGIIGRIRADSSMGSFMGSRVDVTRMRTMIR